jgi:DNA-binding PadR family transcriptional regulator
MGLIEEAKSEGAKKQFAITDAGSAELAAKAEDVAALLARLSAMGEQRAKTDSAPIRRAMGNLRAVLQNRLTRDDVTAETLHDVAAILDEAAQKIERL